MKTYAIVLGGGSGTRMSRDLNKVLMPLRGVPAIVRAIAPFSGLCDGIVVIARADEVELMQKVVQRYGLGKIVSKVIAGGGDRQHSVANGLAALPEDAQIVLIHDGARALVTEQVITRAIESVKTHGTGIASVAVTDTIKRVDEQGRAVETMDRTALRAMQTPQAFRVDDIRRAHQIAEQTAFVATDDAALLEHAAMPVYLCEGSRDNIKLTTPFDLHLAETILALRDAEGSV